MADAEHTRAAVFARTDSGQTIHLPDATIEATGPNTLKITEQDSAEATSASQVPEPIDCGLCLYGSDVGVPGYDHKGPAYINPACPDHNPEPAAPKEN
ncbi:hypothetical protein ACTOXX_34190 [Streptomyces rubiginosohelvolus]|uniref:hypothetical protein n=1 Tax=Streptomyces rubiginosohelvolus TaxID=67362 RepID=UPI003F933FB5